MDYYGVKWFLQMKCDLLREKFLCYNRLSTTEKSFVKTTEIEEIIYQ